MFQRIKRIFDSRKGVEYSSTTVMVVDDVEIDRKIVEKALEKLGCKVLTAVSAEKGLTLAADLQPDIILSDCVMPGMDGMEMCRRLKSGDKTKHIPVIFLTGEGSPQKVIDCFEVEAESYMCKPINPKILQHQIKNILKEHLNS